MDASAEWVIAWTDLILDSTALDEAARGGDPEEVRFRACSIAVRARRYGFDELSRRALCLVERLDAQPDWHPPAHARSVEDILRLVDAITRRCQSP
jgi:hypothetical protein